MLATLLLAATFYKDVLPILQDHCQQCHRPQQIAPMPLMTYAQARAKAKAIAQMVSAKKMPPWFADPRYGHFSNDPSLTDEQIQTVTAWVEVGTPAGDPKEAPPPRTWAEGWNIPQPDSVVQMPKPVSIPSRGQVEYTYEIVPTGFTEDRWIRMSEIRPSSRQYVHHAVVYIRPPDSTWLKDAPRNTPFTASSLHDPHLQHDSHWTDSDMLLVYAPGSSPDRWPEEMAKFVPAGSDLVFQMHYTTNGRAGRDQTSIGLIFAKQPPAKRVLTLQLTNDHFTIPPETALHLEINLSGATSGTKTTAWKPGELCPTMRPCSASSRTCICEENDSSTTSWAIGAISKPCCA